MMQLLCLSPEGGRIASASSNAFTAHAVHEFVALAHLFGEYFPFHELGPDDIGVGAVEETGAAVDADAITAALLRGPVRVWLRDRSSARRISRRLIALDLLEVWAEGASMAELPRCELLRRRLEQSEEDEASDQEVGERWRGEIDLKAELKEGRDSTAMAASEGAGEQQHHQQQQPLFHLQRSTWGLSPTPSSKSTRKVLEELLAAMPPAFARCVGQRVRGTRRLGSVGVAGAPRSLSSYCGGGNSSNGGGGSGGGGGRGGGICSGRSGGSSSGTTGRAKRALPPPPPPPRAPGGGRCWQVTSGSADEHACCARVRFFALLQVFPSAKARTPHRCWLACEPGESAQQGRGTCALHDELERLAVGARPHCGVTPLKPQLAMLAANLARVRRGALVLDPFVGSGSFLAGASSLGAHCFGADIAMSELLGSASGGDGGGSDNDGGQGVFANFDAMALPRPELLCANVLRSPLGAPAGTADARQHAASAHLDAIIADPPYGMRKARHAAHSRGGMGGASGARGKGTAESGGGSGCYDARAASGEELHTAVCAMIEPVLQLAAELLVDGGRLVFLFPTSRTLPWWRELGQERLPRHDDLELVCVCEEVFSQMARNLVCLQRRKRK